jgi:hypothetical protein
MAVDYLTRVKDEYLGVALTVGLILIEMFVRFHYQLSMEI